MPRARDSGDPGPPLPYTGARVLPSALLTASASRPGLFSELILTACFLAVYASSPTSHPVNGNTRYRRAGYAFVGRDFHPLDSFKRFHYLIADPPLPSFSQRDRSPSEKYRS
jgi:hypothetical protein